MTGDDKEWGVAVSFGIGQREINLYWTYARRTPERILALSVPAVLRDIYPSRPIRGSM